MKSALVSKRLEVKQSPIHGYGVFAGEDIVAGDIIEESYALLVDEPCWSLNNYYFGDKEQRVIALGYGSIYNHSTTPNANFCFDTQPLLTITAKTFIRKGDEIFISYGSQWFESRKIIYKDRYEIQNHHYRVNLFLSIAKFVLITGLLFLTLNFASAWLLSQ